MVPSGFLRVWVTLRADTCASLLGVLELDDLAGGDCGGLLAGRDGVGVTAEGRVWWLPDVGGSFEEGCFVVHHPSGLVEPDRV